MKLEELKLDPIGFVSKSSFTQKWGTPRQGALTPEATAEISLYRETGPIENGDHVAILWFAHLNGESFNPLKSRIKPPKKIEGKRSVGVFATRGVHRPSSLGLTFCRTVHVDKDTLTVAGADMIEGTPIMSIRKLYGPKIDIRTVRCPVWTQTQKISISWSLGSFMALSLRPGEHARISKLVETTLSQDPRSVHSLMKHVDPIYEVELNLEQGQGVWIIYRHLADRLEILCATRERVVGEHRSRTKLWLERLLEKLPFTGIS